MMPKVSIIIPTLNSSKTIKKTILSVINQSFKDYEIILLDSFSTDKTLKIIKQFKSKKIRIFSLKKSKKLSYIRYFGILKSRGKYISFLDSDDYWHKDKLKYQYLFMEKKKILFSSTNFVLVKNFKTKKFSYKKNIDFNNLLYDRPIANSSVMITKKIILNISKKYQSTSHAEDYLWWLKASELTKIFNIQRHLTYIGISNDGRTTSSIAKNFKSLVYIYSKIYKFGLFKILLIFIKLFFHNFEKKLFYYF